jgi:hypothetical protein
MSVSLRISTSVYKIRKSLMTLTRQKKSKVILQMSAGAAGMLNEVSMYSQSLRANVRTVTLIDHHHFWENSCKFFFPWSSHQPALYSRDTEVAIKQHTTEASTQDYNLLEWFVKRQSYVWPWCAPNSYYLHSFSEYRFVEYLKYLHYRWSCNLCEERDSAVVEVLCYKPEGHGFETRLRY